VIHREHTIGYTCVTCSGHCSHACGPVFPIDSLFRSCLQYHYLLDNHFASGLLAVSPTSLQTGAEYAARWQDIEDIDDQQYPSWPKYASVLARFSGRMLVYNREFGRFCRYCEGAISAVPVDSSSGAREKAHCINDILKHSFAPTQIEANPVSCEVCDRTFVSFVHFGGTPG